MNRKSTLFAAAALVAMIVLIVVFWQVGMANNSQSEQPAPNSNSATTDPQHLLIPRWFLTGLTVDGQKVEVVEQQQSIQFLEDGSANGEGGCNGFFTSYQAGTDGSMSFGPIGSTKMFCTDTAQVENAYFAALEQVRQYQFDGGTLTMTSDDGKTELTFHMPPK